MQLFCVCLSEENLRAIVIVELTAATQALARHYVEVTSDQPPLTY